MRDRYQEIENLSHELGELKKTDEHAYFERYFNELFPKVRHVVEYWMSDSLRDLYREMRGQYFGLIQTVGSSPEPLVLSIVLLLPKEVLLIHTPETKSYANIIMHHIHLIVKDDPPYMIPKNVDSSKPVEVYQAVKEQWQTWHDDEKSVAIDITGGKKAMVNGAAMAAGVLHLDIFYMDSWDYDPVIRAPKAGTEYLNRLPNPMEVFGEVEFAKAVELFHSLNYSEAAQIFARLYQAVPSEEFGYHVYMLLAEAYSCWDSFDIQKAYGKMKTLCDMLAKLSRYYPRTYPLARYHGWLIKQCEMLKTLNQVMKESVKTKFISLELLQDLEKLIPLIFSLCQNALRRRDQQKFDMGALLLYRVLEMMAQRRLALHDIDTEHPEYPEKERDSLEQTFSARWNAVFSQVKKDVAEEMPDKPLPEKIGLLDGYILLTIWQDELTASLDLMKLYQQVQGRNRSMFAHGFNSMKPKEFEKFQIFVLDILMRFCRIEGLDDSGELLELYAFIQPF